MKDGNLFFACSCSRKTIRAVGDTIRALNGFCRIKFFIIRTTFWCSKNQARVTDLTNEIL